MWGLAKKRRRKWLTGLFSALVLSGIFLGGTVWYEACRNRQYEEKLAELSGCIADTRQTVFLAAENMGRGERVTREKVRETEYYAACSADWFMTEQDLGKKTRFEVAEGSVLFSGMLTSEEREEQREVFLSSVSMGEFMQAGDRLDIRISYRTGEDYVVLSDKELLLYEASGIVLLLSEREIELLSSAMTDVKNYAQTKLYAVRYPLEGQTEKSTVNYLPNCDVAALIQMKEAEIQGRKQLEERLLEAENGD